MTVAKIGFLCGSIREGSINKQLEAALVARAQNLGAHTSIIDMNDYELPIFNGDLTQPENVKKLADKMKTFDGIIITSPEYNGSLPPLLKNAIDWTSTVGTDHITGPVYGIASCTPGPMSGIMGMRQIAYIIGRLGGLVIPVQTGCGNARNAFKDNGELSAQPASDLADKMLHQMLNHIALKAAA